MRRSIGSNLTNSLQWQSVSLVVMWTQRSHAESECYVKDTCGELTTTPAVEWVWLKRGKSGISNDRFTHVIFLTCYNHFQVILSHPALKSLGGAWSRRAETPWILFRKCL